MGHSVVNSTQAMPCSSVKLYFSAEAVCGIGLTLAGIWRSIVNVINNKKLDK